MNNWFNFGLLAFFKLYLWHINYYFAEFFEKYDIKYPKFVINVVLLQTFLAVFMAFSMENVL